MPGLAWRKEKSHVMARARKYPEELLERGTRLVFESGRPIAQVARDLGIESETLRRYVRRVEADEGKRKDLLSSEEREEIRKLRRENFELRRANEILKAASVFFAGELDPHRPK
jgi:transposase